ncbi:MAG: hypothetical protein JWQ75_3791 [Pseudarthrobacter sp.]|nr:hypothetical protein [Pseudarthrobacter sp.]
MAQLNPDAEYSGRRKAKEPSRDGTARGYRLSTPFKVTVWRAPGHAYYCPGRLRSIPGHCAVEGANRVSPSGPGY